MREIRYQPGGDASWIVFVRSGQLLAIDPAGGTDAETLWAAMDRGFQSVLDALTAQGLTATPSFALLSPAERGGLRAIVRGPARLEVVGETLDGTGVSTWTEKIFAARESLELTLGDSTDAPSLPLVSGAVRASLVRWAEPAEVSDASEAKDENASPVEMPAPVPAPSDAAPAAPASAAAAPAADTVASLPEATVQEISEQDAAAPAATDTAASDTADADGYDYLFGATMYRNVSDAAVDDEAPAEADAETPPAAEAEPGPVGDHDGMTIMTGDLRRMRAERKARGETDAAASVPAAPALALALSTGAVEPLDQTIIVGRSPRASQVSGGAIPRLVTIPGDKDISRNHAQFALEGDTVVVTDLHSRNGTQIVMPGRAPQQLRQGEPTSVIVGTVVDLGGGVTLTVREGA